jgi:hypothetical protein
MWMCGMKKKLELEIRTLNTVEITAHWEWEYKSEKLVFLSLCCFILYFIFFSGESMDKGKRRGTTKYKGVFLFMYFVSQYLTSFVTLRSQPSQYMYYYYFSIFNKYLQCLELSSLQPPVSQQLSLLTTQPPCFEEQHFSPCARNWLWFVSSCLSNWRFLY